MGDYTKSSWHHCRLGGKWSLDVTDAYDVTMASWLAGTKGSRMSWHYSVNVCESTPQISSIDKLDLKLVGLKLQP